MKWNAREGKRRFIETMIDTLKISGSQLGKYKDLMTILKISDEVKTYLLQTATVENCEIDDKELLDIFPNDGAKGKRDFKYELKMLNSWMQKQKENDNLEKVIFIYMVIRLLMNHKNVTHHFSICYQISGRSI